MNDFMSSVQTCVMKKVGHPILTCLFAILATVSAAGADPLTSTLVPSTLVRVDDFSLPSCDGGTVSLSRDPTVKFHVLCFLGTECPLARVYGPRLEAMAAEYGDRGVQFIGINSNVQDSMDELSSYATELQLTFPIVKDYDRRVALQFGATRTPEVIVIDRGGAIRYRGRIDDQYQPGLARREATQHDLRNAIEALIDGQPVRDMETTAVGCLIALPRTPPAGHIDVTYCNQVSRVLQQHCVECHREGEIGPFVLDRYDDATGWADMSLEVIDQGRMPPWHASDDHASFANARHMSVADKKVLTDWVAAGMPYGDADDLPPKRSFVQGWQLPEQPQLVLPISDKPFLVPAEGTVEYQYFVIDPGFEEDKWIRAAEVVPGNRSVVHHAIAFIRPPDGADFRDIGMLAAYVPGQRRGQLPTGYAVRVPAHSRIVFQMHYTPTGKPEQDVTRIGIVFAEADQVTHEVIALGGIEQDFEIPPHAAHHTVAGDIGWFPHDGQLLSIMPHMHLRGKSFQFSIESAGKSETLLEVPAYDFNWQHNYELSRPLPLRDIDKLSFTAVFDNSADNPANPDPTEYVTWGDQTWQEMAVTFISVARPLAKKVQPASKQDISQTAVRAQQEANWETESWQFADRYMERFDADGDENISPQELPHSVRIFSFRDFDHNGDSKISRDEIQSEALWRMKNQP